MGQAEPVRGEVSALKGRPTIWGKKTMRIERLFTKDGQSPYADISFRLTTSEIRNPDGSVAVSYTHLTLPTNREV